MKNAFVLAVALTFACTAGAVEPNDKMPGNEAKEKVQNIQSSGGAVKVETKPIVKPEELENRAGESDTVPKLQPEPNPDAAKSSNVSMGGHLFGLHVSSPLPHPVNFGLNYVMPSRLFSAEIGGGSFGLTSSDVKLNISNIDVGLRYHPFAGAFYLGALVGQQTITAQKQETISGFMADVKGEIKSNYVTPHVGWMWGGQNSGFFYSMAVGYQSPSGSKFTLTTNADALAGTPDYDKTVADVTDAADKIGKMGLPYFCWLKMGWMF